MEKRKFSRHTVTAALIYANGPIHIGHLAGCYLPADIYVRYLRSKGEEVLFISGTDEHGVPITLKARNEAVQPRVIVDKYYHQIKQSFEAFGISFDVYSRTSNAEHHKTSGDFFLKLYHQGAFEEKSSEQYFDEKEDQFLADRYIVGTCPNCGYDKAYGDQCERCGTTLSPEELIDPASMLSGEKPVKKTTKNWYLPLDKLQPKIEEYIDGHKEWKANVFGQCKSWLRQGLLPRAMTRDLEWGVKVPLKEAKGKVLYVWFDAPIGYITFTKELAQKENFDWEPYWKDENTKLVHFIGKDNIVFHCIIFPAMLMEHGEFILPENVPANEFMNLEGEKISTSRNWAVWLHEYLKELPGKEDVLRYVLCANAPETKDSDFSWKDYQAKNNNEMVAILGNFINRALVLTHKYFQGKVPHPDVLYDFDEELVKKMKTYPKKIGKLLEGFKFREALSVYMDLARAGNKYLAETEPWKIIKSDKVRVGTILNLSLQLTANLAVLGEPFLPFSAEKIRAMLNLEPGLKWANSGSANLLAEGSKIEKPVLLFEKIDDKMIDQQMDKLEKNRPTESSKKSSPLKNEIAFDDFNKLDLRVGTILSAEKVEGSDKLMKLNIDTGLDKRIVVSGIAKHFAAEELIGKQVTVLVNLAPRKIFGVKSNGMVLMAEDTSGNLRFIRPDEMTTDGSIIS